MSESDKILHANAKDIEHAQPSMGEAMRARLKLSAEKIETLATGLRALANATDPLGTNTYTF